MAMEGVGLGLGVLAEVRTSVKSIQERIACYKEGQVLFVSVRSALKRVFAFADTITVILQASPDALPDVILGIFLETLNSVKDTLAISFNKLEIFCSRAFSGSTNDGIFRAAVRKGQRFVKGKSLDKLMREVEKETTNAAAMLQHQLTQLCMAMKTDKMEANVRNMIEEHPHLPPEMYCAGFNAPLISGKIRLDFDSQDIRGDFFAPEGSLRSLVLDSMSPDHECEASSALFPVHAVSGMTGAGKTTALIGLAHDPKVKECFTDGILYLPLEATSTEKHVLLELSKIMRVTGATPAATEVQSSPSLAAAVSTAAIWFNNKRILFLVDEIWPAPNRPQGYLPDLQILLQGSPESRMVISTRSRDIAVHTGSYVDFGARDPRGAAALGMFLSHAVPGVDFGTNPGESIEDILDHCAGLPRALAVTGGAVGTRLSCGLGLDFACRTYSKLLMREMNLGMSVLGSSIKFSLSCLESIDGGRWTHSISFRELYSSLGCFTSEQCIPIPYLSCMWRIEESSAMEICLAFSSMSLAKMLNRRRADGKEECVLQIHDLHLDYCRNSAAERISLWRIRYVVVLVEKYFENVFEDYNNKPYKRCA